MHDNFFARPFMLRWRVLISVGAGLLSIIYILYDYWATNSKFPDSNIPNPNYIPLSEQSSGNWFFVLFVGVFVTLLLLFICYTSVQEKDQ